MAKLVEINELSEAIKKELETYNMEVTNGIKVKTKEAMNEFVKLTKRDAPQSKTKRKGTFKKNITSRKKYSGMSGDTYEWYVKDPEYRLTHLLKNGHATRSGKRTRPQDFITNNYHNVEEKYIKGVEEVIKNGH